MRFLLYNIRYAAGIGKEFHLPFPYSGYLKKNCRNLEKIAGFIKSNNPDIVGLIEVDNGSFRSCYRNQAETIAKEIGCYHIYQSKYGKKSLLNFVPLLNSQGNAFLTNQKIEAETFHYFDKGVKRLVIELELEDCTLFLVHLSLKFRHRQHQLVDLYSIINESTKPVILAGDFNSFWGNKELELFLAATGLLNANTENLPSHPSREPQRILDFILHSPEIKVNNFEIPKVKFSDHVPLICDFSIEKNMAK